MSCAHVMPSVIEVITCLRCRNFLCRIQDYLAPIILIGPRQRRWLGETISNALFENFENSNLENPPPESQPNALGIDGPNAKFEEEPSDWLPDELQSFEDHEEFLEGEFKLF